MLLRSDHLLKKAPWCLLYSFICESSAFSAVRRGVTQTSPVIGRRPVPGLQAAAIPGRVSGLLASAAVAATSRGRCQGSESKVSASCSEANTTPAGEKRGLFSHWTEQSEVSTTQTLRVRLIPVNRTLALTRIGPALTPRDGAHRCHRRSRRLTLRLCLPRPPPCLFVFSSSLGNLASSLGAAAGVMSRNIRVARGKAFGGASPHDVEV